MKLEQALQILGGNFAKCTVNLNRAFSDRQDGGLTLCFRYAERQDGPAWQTSESTAYVDSSDFLIIALQGCGLLVLPRKLVFYDYWLDHNFPALLQGIREIFIREDGGKILLCDASGKALLDVTEHLRPCEVG